MKPFSSLWSSDEKRIYRIFSILRISSSRPSCTSTKSATSSETAKPRAGMSFSSKIFLNSHGDNSSLCKESRTHSKHGVTPREDDLPFCHTAPVQRKHEVPEELGNILQLSVRLRGSVELQPRSHSFMEEEDVSQLASATGYQTGTSCMSDLEDIYVSSSGGKVTDR